MSSALVTRVLVVDDHALVRDALTVVLNNLDGFQLLGEAADGAQAVQLCAQLQPDVILMDLVMPNMDGIEATRRIRSQWPQIKIIILTAHPEDARVQEAIQAGASGYVRKDCSALALANIMKRAHTGQPVATGTVEDEECGSLA